MFIFRQLAEYLAHEFPLELKPMCVVHQSVQDGVGEGVVVDAGNTIGRWLITTVDACPWGPSIISIRSSRLLQEIFWYDQAVKQW
jgi:hypothetical protein